MKEGKEIQQPPNISVIILENLATINENSLDAASTILGRLGHVVPSETLRTTIQNLMDPAVVKIENSTVKMKITKSELATVIADERRKLAQKQRPEKTPGTPIDASLGEASGRSKHSRPSRV